MSAPKHKLSRRDPVIRASGTRQKASLIQNKFMLCRAAALISQREQYRELAGHNHKTRPNSRLNPKLWRSEQHIICRELRRCKVVDVDHVSSTKVDAHCGASVRRQSVHVGKGREVEAP